MATGKLLYGTNNQAITITLASLANVAYRESTAVDNGTDLFVDVLIGGKITTGTSPTADREIVFYAYGSVDGGTYYSGGVTGSDAGYTPTSDEERSLFFLGVVPTGSTSDHTYEIGPFSLAAALGAVPEDWATTWRNG